MNHNGSRARTKRGQISPKTEVKMRATKIGILKQKKLLEITQTESIRNCKTQSLSRCNDNPSINKASESDREIKGHSQASRAFRKQGRPIWGWSEHLKIPIYAREIDEGRRDPSQSNAEAGEIWRSKPKYAGKKRREGVKMSSSSRLAAKWEAIVGPMKLSNRIRARVVLKFCCLLILKILGAKWKLDDFKNVFTWEEKIFSYQEKRVVRLFFWLLLKIYETVILMVPIIAPTYGEDTSRNSVGKCGLSGHRLFRQWILGIDPGSLNHNSFVLTASPRLFWLLLKGRSVILTTP